MKTGQAGIDLIRQFESCRLEAYKCPAGVWTIGYGHTAGVTQGQKITQAQAEAFLATDLGKFEKKVDKYSRYRWRQNEFDALVSFAFNIGSIDQLTANGTRDRATIAEKMLLYNKAGRKVLAGLVRRRKAEQQLFLQGKNSGTGGEGYYPKYTGTSSSIVSALAAVGEKNTSIVYRKRIAVANGISGYTGTAAQNISMVNLLKAGKLKKA